MENSWRGRVDFSGFQFPPLYHGSFISQSITAVCNLRWCYTYNSIEFRLLPLITVGHPFGKDSPKILFVCSSFAILNINILQYFEEGIDFKNWDSCFLFLFLFCTYKSASNKKSDFDCRVITPVSCIWAL